MVQASHMEVCLGRFWGASFVGAATSKSTATSVLGRGRIGGNGLSDVGHVRAVRLVEVPAKHAATQYEAGLQHTALRRTEWAQRRRGEGNARKGEGEGLRPALSRSSATAATQVA